jgi:tetratricopeptide (TPR) repeat protein
LAIPTLCLALVVGPVPVLAAGPPKSDETQEPELREDPNFERAKEAYRRGTELYAEAKFEEALASFQEAATLYASPDFQFNIAKCYERLGNFEEAIRSYEIYLRTAEEIDDRALIEASIADLKKRIEERDAAANQPEPEPEPEPGKPPPPPGRKLVIAGGALLGVGALVGLGGGLGFGIPVASANGKLGDVLDGGNPDGLTFQEADDLAARAKLFQALELTMIGVGGALAIVGVAVLAVGLKKNKQATTANLQIAPSWGRGSVGLSIAGSF